MTPLIPEKRFFTPEEFTEIFALKNTRAVYRLVQRHELACIYVGALMRIPRDEVQRYSENRRTGRNFHRVQQ